MRAPLARPVSALLAVALLAGCLGADEANPEAAAGLDDTPPEAGGQQPSVEGHVLDAARAPLAGATVEVQNEGVNATTNETGYYSFSRLVDNEVYVLLARLPGYDTKAQQIVVVDDKVVRLDFLLDKTPEAVPYDEVDEREGLLSCEAMIGVAGGGLGHEQPCGAGLFDDPNAIDTVQFALAAGVAGVVVEVKWDSVTPLADFLKVTASSSGYGDLDQTFGEVIGPSVVRIDIAQALVERYYTGAGGLITIHVDAHVEDDDEQAAGTAFAVQQPFSVAVSSFFVEPNPPGYAYYGG